MKVFIWFIAPLLIVLGLSVANVAASARTVSMGETIHGFDIKLAELRKEQKELDGQLASALSLHTLRQEALAQGYVPVSGVAIISSVRPVAMR